MYATATRRYTDDGIATASPARLLTMLYDRLVLDLQRAELAQASGQRDVANAALTHAQDIITELRSSLRLDAWKGAAGLSALYGWWLGELVGANIRGDSARTAAVRAQVEPLREAWHHAARQAPAAVSAG